MCPMSASCMVTRAANFRPQHWARRLVALGLYARILRAVFMRGTTFDARHVSVMPRGRIAIALDKEYLVDAKKSPPACG